MLNWRQATHEDIADIAGRLREADKAEALASTGVDAEFFIRTFCDPSRTYTLLSNKGEPVGLSGVDPVAMNPDVGVVWMVATPDLERMSNQMPFLRRSHEFLDTVLHKDHDLLINYVDARNTAHLRWLRWAGFSFINQIPEWGPYRLPFYQIARLKPCASE